MDASGINPLTRLLYLHKAIADHIDSLSNEQLRKFLRRYPLLNNTYLLFDNCECGCGGRNHVQELEEAARRHRLIRQATQETAGLSNQINPKSRSR
jgi:hypothetical protein